MLVWALIRIEPTHSNQMSYRPVQSRYCLSHCLRAPSFYWILPSPARLAFPLLPIAWGGREEKTGSLRGLHTLGQAPPGTACPGEGPLWAEAPYHPSSQAGKALVFGSLGTACLCAAPGLHSTTVLMRPRQHISIGLRRSLAWPGYLHQGHGTW